VVSYILFSFFNIDKLHSAAYCNRGNAKESLGLFQDAQSDYSKAIEVDPKNKLGMS
jgi:tetratricopeptide (TPR) repeat protein